MSSPVRALCLQMLFICGFLAQGQPLRNQDELFSPTAALAFYDIADDLTNTGSEKTLLPPADAEQALIFLTAADDLDTGAQYVLPDMIKLACRTASPLSLGMADSYARMRDPNDPNKTIEAKDNSQLVVNLLSRYVGIDADMQVVREAVRYLLSTADSREQREQMLRFLLQRVGGKNDLLASDLQTSLGLLAAEKADVAAAQSHFIAAIDKNKYNRLAFQKLRELADPNLNPATYLEHLRYQLGENPLDLQSSLSFAAGASALGLFDTGADAYAYCASLFGYLYPSDPLPQYIYLPWALNLYASQRRVIEVPQVAQKVRAEGTFDVVLETAAAKAVEKTGDAKSARDILNAAEQTAMDKYQHAAQDRPAFAQQLAWFYCFGKVDPARAIDWANRAYAAEPNSPAAAALLAYAFVVDNEPNWAKPFIENYQPSPILDLAKAGVQLADANSAALKTLKDVIAASPQSLEAERAAKLLKDANSLYVPAVDPDLIRSVLEASFGTNIVPVFREPNEIFGVQLNIRGDRFAYGTDFHGSVVIANHTGEPLVISDYGLLRGNIRIDAALSGDITENIPALVSIKVQPSQPIDPDSVLIVPVRLYAGRLRQILEQHPQASVQMRFTVYVDPVTLKDGTVANRLEDIQPVTAQAERAGIKLNAQFLRNRINSLKQSRQSLSTAQLFAGLLMEEHLMANREPTYPFMYAEWMPDVLRSGLVYNLGSDDWPARIYTMSAMLGLPLDLDLMEAVGQNLTDQYWPVRMMALYMLAGSQTDAFDKVLDHTAKYDKNKLVRDMATALGAKQPENP
jgi:hypothetical protein